jgi:hypothetical protein
LIVGLAIAVSLLILRMAQGDINWIDSVRSVPGLFWPVQQ